MLTRRRLLRLALAASAATAAGRFVRAPRARAFGERSRFTFARLRYEGPGANPRPGALVQLGYELLKRTSIDAATQEVELTLADPALFSNPFLWLAGDRALPPFSDADVARLAQFLSFGGFLVIDSAEGRPGGDLDRSVRELVTRLFPGRPLTRVPDDHVLYKSFYLLERPVGRLAAVPYLESLTHDDRELIVYCQNDLGGAFAKDPFLGRFTWDCEPGGEEQRELAFRLGVNLAMYALCLDYKSDQVHVPFILERRRWQPAE